MNTWRGQAATSIVAASGWIGMALGLAVGLITGFVVFLVAEPNRRPNSPSPGSTGQSLDRCHTLAGHQHGRGGKEMSNSIASQTLIAMRPTFRTIPSRAGAERPRPAASSGATLAVREDISGGFAEVPIVIPPHSSHPPPSARDRAVRDPG